MMDILMSEKCWAHKKWNKIASDIKLIFHSSTITMMHGPIKIRFVISPPPPLPDTQYTKHSTLTSFLSWDIPQLRLAVSYRLFETACRPHVQCSSSPNRILVTNISGQPLFPIFKTQTRLSTTEPIVCPETFLTDHQSRHPRRISVSVTPRGTSLENHTQMLRGVS